MNHTHNIRVLVTGGRNYADREKVFETLNKIHKDTGIDTIIHGKARGADSLADEWAIENGVNIELFPAEWDRYGRAAGAIRNRQMLLEGQPDMVVAFPGGNGTRDMVTVTQKYGAGLPLMEVS